MCECNECPNRKRELAPYVKDIIERSQQAFRENPYGCAAIQIEHVLLATISYRNSARSESTKPNSANGKRGLTYRADFASCESLLNRTSDSA